MNAAVETFPEMPINLPEQPDVDSKGDAGKVLRWINTCLLALGGMMAWTIHNNVEDGRRESKAAILSLETKFIALDKDSAVTNANRFTVNDHIKFADAISVKFNEQDKRLTRVEDSLTAIKDSLVAIKSGLGLPVGK